MSIALMSLVWKINGLTQAQKLVLLSLADNSNDEGVCWPSISAIADRCCMVPRSVTRTVNELEDLGYVTRDVRSGKRTVYNITPDLPSPLTESHPDSKSSRPSVTPTPDRASPPPDQRSSLPHTPYKEITLKEPSLEITPKLRRRQKKSERPPKYTDRFSVFWDLYPRRDGSKFEAAEIFHNLTTGGMSDEILIDGAGRYAEYVSRNAIPSTKVAHATTWLNGRRWEAEYGADNIPGRSQHPSKTSDSLAALYAARNRVSPGGAMESDPVRGNSFNFGQPATGTSAGVGEAGTPDETGKPR